jgi:ADP-ribose pyrophosphatase YjhB (NUDIX family)
LNSEDLQLLQAQPDLPAIPQFRPKALSLIALFLLHYFAKVGPLHPEKIPNNSAAQLFIMLPSQEPLWLDWTKRLQAIAQNGLTFAKDPFDIERYQALREIAAEIIAQGGGLPLPVVRGILEKEKGYATPKTDVRGVVFQANKILLVRERSEGLWTLPGGWADPCASPAENIVREILEESGFQTKAEKILAFLDRSKHPHEPLFAFHVYKVFFFCSLQGGENTLSTETDAVEFFAEENLPPLSLSRVTPDQIHRMFHHHRNPDLSTDFDHPGP